MDGRRERRRFDNKLYETGLLGFKREEGIVTTKRINPGKDGFDKKVGEVFDDGLFGVELGRKSEGEGACLV